MPGTLAKITRAEQSRPGVRKEQIMIHSPETTARINTAIGMALYNHDYLSVTLWGLPNENVRVTKRVYGKKQEWDYEMLVSIGKPNYKERQFLRSCKKEGSKPDYFYVGKKRRAKTADARVTSANRPSTKYCSPEFHRACHKAGCVECPHCRTKV